VAAEPASSEPVPREQNGPSLEPDEVLRTLSALERALETKDLPLYKSLRPGISAAEERRLGEVFTKVSSQDVNLAVQGLTIEGNQATAQVLVSSTVDGKPVPARACVFRLVKGPGGWAIDAIE
jgi:hypothetical protein